VLSGCVAEKFETKHLAEDDKKALKDIVAQMKTMSMKELVEYASPHIAVALEDAFAASIEIEALKYVPEVLAKAKAAAQVAAVEAVEKATPAVAQAVAAKAVHLSCTHTLSAIAEYSVQFATSLFPVMAVKTRTEATTVAQREITNPESIATCTRMGSDVIRAIAAKSVAGAENLAERESWGPDLQRAAELAARLAAKRIAIGHRELYRSRIEHAVEDAVRALGLPARIAFPTPQPMSKEARDRAAEAAAMAKLTCMQRITDPRDILQIMGCNSGALAAEIAMKKIPTALDTAFGLLRGGPGPGPAPGPGGAPAPVVAASPASFMVLHQHSSRT